MAEVVVIGFGVVFRGDEVLLVSLEGMIKLWEETRISRNQYHIMVTLKGRSNGETGGEWHMMPLVGVKGSGIYIRKWVGRWLKVLVEEKRRTEGWVV